MVYFKLLIALVVIGSLAGNTYLYEKNIELNIKNDTLSATVKRMEQEVKEAEASRLALSRENQKLNTEYQKAANKLDTYRDRESTVLTKKGLVQIKLNKSFAKSQKNLSCITGGECEQ